MFTENNMLLLYQMGDELPDISERDNSKHLWVSVLERAIQDLEYVDLRSKALAWILSRRESIGSFAWICRCYIHLNPKRARDAILSSSFVLRPPTEYWDRGRRLREIRKKAQGNKQAA